ncbi:hypothetical protein Barb4_03111 [Bacteroidales bacterium Barb4]|nr:hypothetical protein Barb4_03111 [Bacteroidales bacterium Barb4]
MAKFSKLCVIPFLSPFPAPRRIISMKIPQATEKPVRNVRSLFFLTVPHISRKLSNSNTCMND